MSEFEIISQIINEIDEDLDKVDKNKLKALIESKARKQNLDENILNFLSEETELKDFVKAFKDACNIQICFLIDVTGSMASFYDNFTNQVLGCIIDGILNAVNKGEKRYAYIGYRERNEPHEFHPFTTDHDKIIEAIRNTEPRGGSDPAEDVEHAFDLFVKNIVFKSKGTRIIIHVTDSPCHGENYHDEEIQDNHPEWSDEIPRLLSNISNNFNCFYWFFRVTKHTDKMIREFNKILSEVCETDGLNKITEVDLSTLKGDIRKHIKNLLHGTVMAATMI